MISVLAIREGVLYSVKEACSLLGVARATLYRYVKAKGVRLVKVGGRSYIRGEDLKRFME